MAGLKLVWGTPGIGRRSRKTKAGGAVRAGEGRCSRIGFGIRP
ncbi:hypothetical protein [Clostridium sp. chh4-2]|nr:hypothetical protein [Clostridium sp. chh4-2]